jgi:hypothetical protein
MAAKMITPITRRPELSRAAFRDYYETRHAPLGTRYFPFEKYVRNHLTGSTPDGVGFDCLMECWIDHGRAMEVLTGDIDRLFLDDEARFMVTRGIGIAVEERTLAGPPRGVDPPGVRKEILLVRKPEGESHDGFVARLTEWGKSLAGRIGQAISRLTLDAVKPEADRPVPVDAFVTAWVAEGPGIFQGVELPAGVTVTAIVRADSCETPPETMKAAFAAQRGQ